MILVPVDRYRISYDVLSRRESFALDCLLLWAIGKENITAVEDLEQEFCLHRRVLIESLLRLFDAALIGLPYASTGRFVATAAGKRWLNRYSEPSALMRLLIISEPRPTEATVVRELMTGALTLHRRLVLVTKKQLLEDGHWEYCVPVSKDITSTNLQEDDLREILPHKDHEWVFRIKANVPAGGGELYRPVVPDLKRGIVRGLPARWRNALTFPLLEFARTCPEKASKVVMDMGEDYAYEGPPYRFPVLPRDLTCGVDQMRGFLEEFLRHSPRRSRILIVAPGLTADAISTWKDALANALQNECVIDLVWGTPSGAPGAGTPLQAIEQLRSEVGRLGGSEWLRVNQAPVGLATHMILRASLDGSCEAAIATEPWLASPGPRNRLAVAVRIGDSAMLATACLALAATLEAYPNRLGTIAPHRWRIMANRFLATPHLAEKRTDHEAGMPICSAGWLRESELPGAVSWMQQAQDGSSPVRLAGAVPGSKLRLAVEGVQENGEAEIPRPKVEFCSTESAVPLAASRRSLLIGFPEPADRNPESKPIAIFRLGLLASCEEWAEKLWTILAESSSTSTGSSN
jgi:hypothetical protein